MPAADELDPARMRRAGVVYVLHAFQKKSTRGVSEPESVVDSIDTALRLVQLFRMSGQFWTSLQADWDLWHAAHALRKAG